MKLLSTLHSFMTAVLRRTEVENDMDDELRSHIQHRADDLERSGIPPAEAGRRAGKKFAKIWEATSLRRWHRTSVLVCASCANLPALPRWRFLRWLWGSGPILPSS